MQEGDEGDAELLQEQLCSALCCLAEAQMGLAGDVQEVAGECEALLLRAARAAQSSAEPMQVETPLDPTFTALPSRHKTNFHVIATSPTCWRCWNPMQRVLRWLEWSEI